MALRFYFLLATILTLPFAIRKVLWVEQNSFFNEYRDISIYAFEVFLIGYVLCSLLQHKIYLKSILKKVFHVEHLLILLILGISTIVSAFFDQEYQGLYFYIRWLTYFVFSFFLYKDLKLIVPRGTVDNSDQNCSTWNIPLLNKYLKLFHVEHSPSTQITSHCSTWNNLLYIVGLSLLFQAILIICQFIKQQSLGLIYLGESILHPAIAGVATIIVSNIEILRGYGTFLHPNIAAFFFLVYGIAYILLSIVPRGTLNNENCSTWNIPFLKKWQKLFHVEHFFSQELTKIVPRGTIWLLLGVILLGFILTFSKSVIGLVIILAILWYFLANCSTWNIQSRNKGIQLFHVEQS